MLLIAVVPAVALMIFIYFQDNHEREPIGLLIKIFVLGILSAIPAVLLEWGAEKMIDITFGGTHLLYYAVDAFFGVAIIEEGVKFLAAYFLTWRNKNFNYKFDGIVYCLFGSMGFAAIENVMYVFMGGSDMALSTGISRGLLAIPCHGMCAIFMGYYYGNAKYLKSYGDRLGCKRNMITGFLLASSLHAFYDFCLFTQMGLFTILFFIFVIIADVFTIVRIHKARRENQKMYEEPKYRQYWAGPAANPYQPYGGYAAPSYGGYAAPNNNVAAAPQVVAENTYNPQVMAQNTFAPQGISQNTYNPQGVSQNTYTQQGANPTTHAPHGASQNTYAQQGNGSVYMQGQPAQGTAYTHGTPQTQFAQTSQTANNIQKTQQSQYTQQPGQPVQQQFAASQHTHQKLEFNDDAQNLQRREFVQPEYKTGPTGQPAQPQTYQTPGIRERMIKCPACGTVVSFNAFYCKSCGASIHQL